MKKVGQFRYEFTEFVNSYAAAEKCAEQQLNDLQLPFDPNITIEMHRAPQHASELFAAHIKLEWYNY